MLDFIEIRIEGRCVRREERGSVNLFLLVSDCLKFKALTAGTLAVGKANFKYVSCDASMYFDQDRFAHKCNIPNK